MNSKFLKLIMDCLHSIYCLFIVSCKQLTCPESPLLEKKKGINLNKMVEKHHGHFKYFSFPIKAFLADRDKSECITKWKTSWPRNLKMIRKKKQHKRINYSV